MDEYKKIKSNYIDLVGACLIYIGMFQLSSDVKIAVVSSVAFITAFTMLSQFPYQNALLNSIGQRTHVMKFTNALKRLSSTRMFTISTIGFTAAFVLFVSVQTYKTPGMATSWLMPTLSIVYVLFCLAIVFENRLNSKNISPTLGNFTMYFMIFLGILSGHGVRDSYETHVIFYTIFGALTSYFLVSIYLYEPNTILKFFEKRFSFLARLILSNLLIRKLGYFALIVLFSIFSFRTDVLNYSSSVLHWSYFTGPTYELNFQNYSETLSQYSLFFSVLAKSISPNPFYSVWLLQAVLLNLVFFMGIWATRTLKYSLTIASLLPLCYFS